ncbi:MAG: TlpA family protein disulfide reductase [Anaerolineales bacterium]
MRSLRPLGLVGAGILLGAALGMGYFLGVPETAATSPAAPPAAAAPLVPVVGAPAPDFTLAATDGVRYTLSELRGQIVVLNFWATWCTPCRIEMPMLQARYERDRENGLIVLGVNFDEPAADVRLFGQELAISFPLLLDPGAEVQRLYRVRGYPSTFVIDREGKLVVEHIGLMSESQLDDYLAKARLLP